ncbi:MAG: hypothetical protein KIT33_08370 [Candidatus Kapabacteria bacterium]|nr:hypothetical protein [Ignavibacteriota bacterium]MCW5884969.1 hypothetical protein [Candidatus Kapabacteria bacterium]
MKIFTTTIRISLVSILLLMLTLPLFAQDDDWRSKEQVDTRFPYLKEKYEDTLNLDFEKVWESAIKCIEDINCMIITKNPRAGDDGLYRGTLQSDYCVFALGDTVLRNLKYYSVELPFIRGGIWENARFQYKFIIRELEEGGCYVRITGEISGKERLVTNKVHFWQSNGFKEYQMMERLKMECGLPHDFKENL